MIRHAFSLGRAAAGLVGAGFVGGLAVIALVAVACSSSTADAPAAVDAGAPDAAGDAVDNGAPSTDYPAPHPALPELVNGTKGPVLTAPKVMLIFYPNDPREPALDTFASKMAGSSFWSSTTSEYGVGPLTYAGKIELTGETPPTTISDSQVQAYMADALASGKLGTPDPQTIYTLLYPNSTTITQVNPISTLLGPVKSCETFIGYHDNVSVAVGDAGTKNDFAYAVIPGCPLSDGPTTSAMGHEWIEAATDPELTSNGVFSVTGGPNAAFFAPDADHTVWALLGGGEAADLCVPSGPSISINPAEIGYPVERTWSNVAARASHDPCVPHLPNDTAYFAAAPVLTKDVAFTTTFTGDVKTKGIVIPVGGSATIEVDLFSDAALDGPITVKAQDLLATYYANYGFDPSMTFTWDRTQGVNGEKLHLTVTVTTATPLFGGAHGFMITAAHANRFQVWPGLIVEQ